MPTCIALEMPTKKEVFTSLSICLQITNMSDFTNLLSEAARNNYCVNIKSLNSIP